jgi:S-adenosylmethionine hydrolase
MARTYRETVTTPAAATRGVSGRARPFISLLSDFGLRDPSAGIMRAVVAGIAPTALVVDLAHDVDKFAIRDGALLLWSAVPYLPVGAHVAVVDPGVGTERKGIVVQVARGDFLVGPDNGLLMPAAARLGGITRAHLLENPRYSLPEVSSSFHGRDVFAPAAAHIVDGVSIEDLGRAVDPRRLLPLEWPRPSILPGRLRSQVIYVDTFGNVKLSALAEDLAAAIPDLRFGESLLLTVGEDGARPGADGSGSLVTWARTFGEVPAQAPLLTSDSYGRVTLAVHQGSAAAAFGVGTDAAVAVSRPAARRPAAGSPRGQSVPTAVGPPRPGASGR